MTIGMRVFLAALAALAALVTLAALARAIAPAFL
jgi:hypothetical protein